jgi:cytochrome P450
MGGPMARSESLEDLRSEFDSAHDVWRGGSGRVYVADPDAARDVMGNRRAGFVETADFFHTRYGVFGPRQAQIRIGRMARHLLQRHLDAHRDDLPRLIDKRLAPASAWPDAGNLLVREHLSDVLLRQDAAADLREVVDGVITRAVLAGARGRHSVLSRAVFRRRVRRVLCREIRALRAEGVGEPRDLLDVTVAGAGPAARIGDLAEVYLSFLFATVGSIGFALGWSVFLAGTHPDDADDEPGWIVREALRLWPVAWLFGRTPAREHNLAGVPVGPSDQVVVCSYLVHRHPEHWRHPDEFVPRRWASVREPAFMPFGFGPHTCAGATVTMALLEDLVRLITRERHLRVVSSGERPTVGAALAPPRFTAYLSESMTNLEGGEHHGEDREVDQVCPEHPEVVQRLR